MDWLLSYFYLHANFPATSCACFFLKPVKRMVHNCGTKTFLLIREKIYTLLHQAAVAKLLSFIFYTGSEKIIPAIFYMTTMTSKTLMRKNFLAGGNNTSVLFSRICGCLPNKLFCKTWK